MFAQFKKKKKKKKKKQFSVHTAVSLTKKETSHAYLMYVFSEFEYFLKTLFYALMEKKVFTILEMNAIYRDISFKTYVRETV